MATKTRSHEPVLQRYVFQGLAVQFASMLDAEDNEERSRKHKGHPRLRPIAQHDIDTTGARFKHCKCESLGLHAGMTLDALIHMGAGCTDSSHRFNGGGGWVCPRLDSLRRMYGH